MAFYRVHFSVFHDIEASNEKEALAAAVAQHTERQFLAFESCELITDEVRTSFALPGGGHATFTGIPDKETLQAVASMVNLAKNLQK